MGCKDEFQISSAVKREKYVFTAEFEDVPLMLFTHGRVFWHDIGSIRGSKVSKSP